MIRTYMRVFNLFNFNIYLATLQWTYWYTMLICANEMYNVSWSTYPISTTYSLVIMVFINALLLFIFPCLLYCYKYKEIKNEGKIWRVNTDIPMEKRARFRHWVEPYKGNLVACGYPFYFFLRRAVLVIISIFLQDYGRY